MNDIRNILQDADPLRHEPPPSEGERDRIRHAAVAAASHATTSASSAWFRTPVALVAMFALIIVGVVVFGSRSWTPGSTTVQAAVRFEVRLAEDQPAAGLRAVKVGGDRTIYLHEEIVVTNADIERSAVVPGSSPSQFGVGIQFNAGGARKMREATASHVGRPMAILIDGDVVMAPTLRDPIGRDALISGDYSRAEAERIVNGMSIR